MKKITLIFSFFILFTLSINSQSLKCAYCGQPIKQSYIVFEEKPYHDSCYRNFVQPRCAKCNQPIDGKFIMKDGKKYHEKCYNQSVALRCDLCGEVINGEYIIDYWGNNYHAYHEGSESRCDYCGRFISGNLSRGGLKYNDGRVICGLCEATSVKSLTKAQSVLSSVKNSLQSFGVSINLYRIGLKLVDKNELKSIAVENGRYTDPRGFAKYSYWKTNGVTSKQEFTIYILNGMPQKDFEAVAAHELMHIWQYINSPEKLEPQLAEGSAEYVSFLHMSKQYDDYSKYIVYKIENNDDNIYGDGFRRVKSIVDKKGFNYLLNHLRKSNKLPTGY